MSTMERRLQRQRQLFTREAGPANMFRAQQTPSKWTRMNASHLLPRKNEEPTMKSTVLMHLHPRARRVQEATSSLIEPVRAYWFNG